MFIDFVQTFSFFHGHKFSIFFLYTLINLEMKTSDSFLFQSSYLQDSNYDAYVKGRVCPLGFRRLHEFIFFHENIRKLELNNLAQVSYFNKEQLII